MSSSAIAQQFPSRSTTTKPHQTFFSVVRSEWSKLLTLRSTFWTTLLTLLITAGLGFMAVKLIPAEHYEPTMLGSGMPFGVLTVSILATLTFTSEYSSGQIRSTLAATPKRGRLYGAKALISVLYAFATGALSILLTLGLCVLFSAKPREDMFTSAHVNLIWQTGIIYAVIAAMSFGFAQIIRSTAGTISCVMVLLYVASTILTFATAKWEWMGYVLGALPLDASKSVYLLGSPMRDISPDVAATTSHGPASLTDTQSLIAFALWAIIPLVIGYMSIKRRDA